MADPAIVQISGLMLSNNTFSASPPGSLSKADNGVINSKGIFQPRNGQERASTVPAANDLPFSLVEFQQHILAQYGTSKTDVTQKLGYVNAGTITPYSGTFNPVGDNGSATDYMRMHFTLASLFLHFCCASGPRTLETYNGTPRRSGLSRVPDFTALMGVPAGTQPGVIPYNSSVAYRYAHKRITSTGQVLISPPSNRFIVTNRFSIPAGGLVRAGTTVTATVTPGQIWQHFVLPLVPGNNITVSPGEADFPAGSKLVTGAPATNKITWTEAGAAVASTITEELNPGPLFVELIIELPVNAIAGDIIQIFKSVATSDSNIEPSEDVYLCNEILLSAGDIVSGGISPTDYTPQSVLQVPLYTNPSDGDGQGELGANFPPPIYLDNTNFDGKTFYLGTTGQQYLSLQMLGVGGPDGVQNNDTITIFDGVSTTKVYTFKTVAAGPGEIPLISDGTPGYNIAWTTYFLCLFAGADLRVVGVDVVGGTSPNGFPGGIRIERTDYLQTPFQVKVSRPTSWAPALQSATYTNSFGSAQANGLMWGKNAQPEAVPVINNIGAGGVGVSNYYGRRCFGLRNSLIILKEGDGIWSLTGSGGNYSLLQISTANTIAPDCACVFADSVWAYTDQGILRISDSGGVQCVSRQLETELVRLATLFPAETYAWSFAVPYETERRIMFFVPFAAATSGLGGAPLMQAWCYSQATNAWTGPLYVPGSTIISGVVSTSHLLYEGIFDGRFSAGRITSERKTDSYLDVADAAWPAVLATTGNPLVVQLLTTGAGLIQKGSGLSQVIGGTTYRTKVSAALGANLYQVSELVPWADGGCTIYDSFPVEVQFTPEGSPGSRKVLTRLFTLYKPLAFANYFGVTTLETDQMPAELEIATPAVGYGMRPYGVGPYGDPSPQVVDSNPIDPKWVSAGQFYPGMKFDEVWLTLKLQGLGMSIEGATAPVGRGK